MHRRVIPPVLPIPAAATPSPAPSSAVPAPRVASSPAATATAERPGHRARRRHRLACVLIALALLLAVAPDARAASAEADPQALQVAERVMEALGGEEAWAATRLVRFDFAGRRTHHWDKGTGRHRLEGDDREGHHYVVLQDLDDRQGRAWLDGEEVAGAKLDEMLEMAYGAWVNDTYWLLMPYKLLDPGVHLSYEGTEAEGSTTYDVLGLSFGEVGLTPGDRYWAWIDRDTGLMDRWAYRLQSQAEDAEPTAWRWEGWDWYGPAGAQIRLAPRREMADGTRTLDLAPIEVSADVPEKLFTAP